MEDSQLMTELPGLTTGTTTTTRGCTTLLQHRSGHYYHLHQPHLALSAPQNGTLPLKSTNQAGGVENRGCVNGNGGTTGDYYGGAGNNNAGNGYPGSGGRNRYYVRHVTTDISDYASNGQGISRLLADLNKRTAKHSETTHISSLYPEILALIFSNLDVRDKGRAAQVCMAWRDASYHRSVWRGVEAKLHLRKQSPALFTSLVRRGIKRVQILSLRRGLGEVMKGMPSLESLNLSGCYNVTDTGLTNALCQDFLPLLELNLSLCKQVTDASLSRITQYLKNLESLELGGCSNITNTGLLLIAWGLRRLKRLDLRSCWHVSDQGICHIAGLNPETAQGNLALEYLSLQDCQRLSDEALRHVSVGLTKLKSINLSFCVAITDSGLKHLAKMPSLKELNLRSCDNISDVGMAYLAEGGSRISSLDVSFCEKIGDQALVHISQGLFNIKSLSLSACQVSDEGVCKIAKTLHDLETLNIGQCSRITDKGLHNIADSMKHLKCIDLYGCTRITTDGLERIMKLPQLSSLNLGLWHMWCPPRLT